MVGKKNVIGIWNLEIKVMRLNVPTNVLQVGGTTCNTVLMRVKSVEIQKNYIKNMVVVNFLFINMAGKKNAISICV